MPSDSVRKWPIAWDMLFTEGNPDNTVSVYDNVQAPWGLHARSYVEGIEEVRASSPVVI